MVMTSHKVISDIFNLENVVQMTGITHAKSILIDHLRELFRQDSFYVFRTDVFGFPLTPSLAGLEPDAGLNDDSTTRIFIGSSFRYDVRFCPAIVVKNTSTRYIPLSFNQDLLSVIYTNERLVDGYGNETIIRSPSYHTLVGAWDQTFEVKVIAEDEYDREEIADIVMVTLQGSRRMELQREGVFIKSISTSGENEQVYANDYFYSVSINLDVRSEWKIHIPISNLCERIGMCILFEGLGGAVNDDFSIHERITSVDNL